MDEIAFTAEIIHWRGPSPFFFVPLPDEQAAEVARLASLVSYGWGMIPVDVKIGDVDFYTALYRKDGTYYLPLKDAVRGRTGLTAGDVVEVRMRLRPPKR